MTTHCAAIYERGQFRPTQPIGLEEGAQVELVVIRKLPGVMPRSPAEVLAEIAALPTAGGDPATGRDHDKVLYGQQGAR